jgi:hypothetical protein
MIAPNRSIGSLIVTDADCSDHQCRFHSLEEISGQRKRDHRQLELGFYFEMTLVLFNGLITFLTPPISAVRFSIPGCHINSSQIVISSSRQFLKNLIHTFPAKLFRFDREF